MDENNIVIHISDVFTPITPGSMIVDLTDNIRVADQKIYVSAFVERDGCLLVERIEDGNIVLPRAVIAKGESHQDALFRIFRTKYSDDVIIGDLVVFKDNNIPIKCKTDVCYKVTINSNVEINDLTWIRL